MIYNYWVKLDNMILVWMETKSTDTELEDKGCDFICHIEKRKYHCVFNLFNKYFINLNIYFVFFMFSSVKYDVMSFRYI